MAPWRPTTPPILYRALAGASYGPDLPGCVARPGITTNLHPVSQAGSRHFGVEARDRLIEGLFSKISARTNSFGSSFRPGPPRRILPDSKRSYR